MNDPMHTAGMASRPWRVQAKYQHRRHVPRPGNSFYIT